MRKPSKFALIVLMLSISLACVIPVSTPEPTALPIARLPDTATPVPPASPVPSDTPPAPTVTPIPGLNKQGPYILYQATGIWISNPDGSGLTQLTTLQSDHLDLHRAISPQGDKLALVAWGDTGLNLVQVGIPSGGPRILAHLLDIQRDDLIVHPTSTRAFAAYAIKDYDSFAWQPGEGRLLAFMSALNNPTADLSIYDTQSAKITPSLANPSQAVEPNWSPDGQYILYHGGSWAIPLGGAIGPYTHLDGVWALNVATRKIIPQTRPRGLLGNFVGWQDNTHYLVYDSDEKCFSQNLRSVDVTTGKATPLTNLSFYYQIAQSPENQALLFAGAAGCRTSPGDGVFLLLPGQSMPTKLLDKKAYEVRWLPESKVFQAYPEALFSADGQTRYDPPVYDKSFHPAISKQGFQAWEVIENQQGRVMVKAPGGDWQTIQSGLVDQLLWNPASGDTLLIAMADGTLYAASAPDFTPHKMGWMGGHVNQVVWTP